MGKFCGNCGSELNVDGKFCPICGQQLALARQKTVEQFNLKSFFKRYLLWRLRGFLWALIILSILSVGFMFMNKMGLISNLVVVDKSPDKPWKMQQKASSKPSEDSSITKAQRLLEEKKIQGKVLATSFGNNPKGFLSIIKNNEQYSFVIVDQVNQQVAEVSFSQEKYSFIDNVNQKYVSPLIFNITIFNDKHDRDEKNGAWNGEKHLIPIYAQYEFDQNGNVVPGMLNTAWGAKPSHYQGYLNEQKNVDIANLFLTEMKALRENARVNQVSIPVN